MNSHKDLIHGVHPVLEAIRADVHVEKVLVRRDAAGAGVREVQQAARAAGVPVTHVPAEKLDRLVRGEHQGVVAFVSQVDRQDIGEVIIAAYERGEQPLVVVLDGVTDVRNLGAIARSAECMGAHALVVPASGSARLGPDAVKSSAGALLRIPVCRVKAFNHLPATLAEHGLRVVACTEKASIPLADTNLQGPLAILLGAEETGISLPLLRRADVLARIPMRGGLGSLNVSVAAGIVLYEVVRQRG